MKMCEALPESDWQQTEFSWTSSAEGSPAKISALQARAQDLRGNGRAYGENTPELLARFDPASSSWKTSQHCFIEGLATFSGTWPRSGMMRSGIAFQLPPLARLTDATASGLWPTPNTIGWRSDGELRLLAKMTTAAEYITLSDRAASSKRKKWQTPTARAWRDMDAPAESRRNSPTLGSQVGGKLNPTWVEWLMGFPLGWTDCGASATPSSRKSRS